MRDAAQHTCTQNRASHRADGSRRAWATEVRDAVRGLDEPVRRVVELSYFHGLGQDGIAARLQMSTREVSAAVATGLRALAAALVAGAAEPEGQPAVG